MDAMIQADSINFDHDHFYSDVQRLTLDFRINEPICSLVNYQKKKTSKNIYFRVGSHLVKHLFWKNTLLDIWFVDASAT